MCRVLFVLVVAVHSAVFVANVACCICIPGTVLLLGIFRGYFQATFGPKINIFFSPIFLICENPFLARLDLY